MTQYIFKKKKSMIKICNTLYRYNHIVNNDKNTFKMVTVRTPNRRSAGNLPNTPNAPKKPRRIRGCTSGGRNLMDDLNKESDSNSQNSRN